MRDRYGDRTISRSSVPFMLVAAIVVVYTQVDTIMIFAVFVAATYAFGILIHDERDILRRLGARVGLTRGGRENTGGPPAGDGAPMSINSGGP